VLEKDQTVHMTSASYGITDPHNPNYYAEDISLCVRISYSGEYCHSADWNIPDHGVRNASHGCVNMNPSDAQWLFTTFQIGDVVDVRNSPVPLPIWDGIADWCVPWAQYGS
jgi:lipoprotein-anchoring transpeptidase ErfK/SrfK